jgi:hypothetical protein
MFSMQMQNGRYENSFEEIVFADDLNSWKQYEAGTPADTMLQDMKHCQRELHAWGSANQVTFDPAKENLLVLNRHKPHGGSFKLLGVDFDCKLSMSDAVYDLAKECKWKLKAVLRTRKFNTGGGLINLYKAQILSFIEYRTAAIYHACSTALSELDSVQTKLLEAAGATETEALLNFHLAPLAARRDMALLGLMHRTVLGRGPPQFRRFFELEECGCHENKGRHRLQIKQLATHWSDFALPGSRPAGYIEQSMFGFVKIYNLLPPAIVEASPDVPSFQTRLQEVLGHRANAGHSGWQYTFSPRASGVRFFC